MLPPFKRWRKEKEETKVETELETKKETNTKEESKRLGRRPKQRDLSSKYYLLSKDGGRKRRRLR